MTATFLDAIAVGRVIDGRFPLLHKLGGTERTSAWLTELDDGWAQKAAIKIFSFESVDADAAMLRWDIARTISHPHLMPLLDAGRCEIGGEDLFYVVTEYADETLSRVLPQRPLSTEEAREMLGPVLEALGYLHKLGLTHGHLRPANIMVVGERLKLSPDFGWCSPRRGIYDPPEAVAGNLSPTADIWALGILLVEALTQQPPFWDGSQAGEPEIPAAIPEPFFTICRECLRIDPERRCALAEIEARLNSTCRPEVAAGPAEAADDQPMDCTDEPFFQFRAMILAGAVLGLLFLSGAFKLGWDLTPSSLEMLPKFPAPAVFAAPPPPAPLAPASSAAAASHPRPAPARPTPIPRASIGKLPLAQPVAKVRF
jgi:serine/threonine protein kinase